MITICTDASGLIVMLSDGGSPTPPDGGASFQISPIQSTILRGLANAPNGGIMFVDGIFTALPFVPPPVIDNANSDNLDKKLKAVLLAASIMAGRTATQAKAAFMQAYQSLNGG